MSLIISDLVRTISTYFRFGTIRLKDNSGTLQLRDSGDTDFVNVEAGKVTSDEEVETPLVDTNSVELDTDIILNAGSGALNVRNSTDSANAPLVALDGTFDNSVTIDGNVIQEGSEVNRLEIRDSLSQLADLEVDDIYINSAQFDGGVFLLASGSELNLYVSGGGLTRAPMAVSTLRALTSVETPQIELDGDHLIKSNSITEIAFRNDADTIDANIIAGLITANDKMVTPHIEIGGNHELRSFGSNILRLRDDANSINHSLELDDLISTGEVITPSIEIGGNHELVSGDATTLNLRDDTNSTFHNLEANDITGNGTVTGNIVTSDTSINVGSAVSFVGESVVLTGNSATVRVRNIFDSAYEDFEADNIEAFGTLQMRGGSPFTDAILRSSNSTGLGTWDYPDVWYMDSVDLAGASSGTLSLSQTSTFRHVRIIFFGTSTRSSADSLNIRVNTDSSTYYSSLMYNSASGTTGTGSIYYENNANTNSLIGNGYISHGGIHQSLVVIDINGFADSGAYTSAVAHGLYSANSLSGIDVWTAAGRYNSTTSSISSFRIATQSGSSFGNDTVAYMFGYRGIIT